MLSRDSHFIRELRTAVGRDRVITDPTRLSAYSYDGQQERSMPNAVVDALTTDEVAAVLRIAAGYGIPVVPRGAGSGMTGGSVPEIGGVVINFERMNRIIAIDAEDRIGYVQPGVITATFQDEAARHGLFYPPEPASAAFSSLGGNVAESAGGLGCVKYGLTKDFVAGLVFVTSDGTVVKTGVYSDLQSPFDVGALLAGSEGMLGVITEIALRLIPLPESRLTVLALFQSLPAAATASNAILAAGVIPAVLEFMDRACIDVVREYAGIEIPETTGAALLVEVDGPRDRTVRQHEIITGVFDRLNPIKLMSAETDADRATLWKLRKSLSPAVSKIAPVKFNEDICVPLSKIPEFCAFVEELAAEKEIKIVAFGHSGDGNIHVNIMTSWKRPAEIARVHAALEELFTRAVAMGGTLSGEHGIGIAKRAFIPIALDPPTIDFEKRIKRAFDPAGILNPGKMFPA